MQLLQVCFPTYYEQSLHMLLGLLLIQLVSLPPPKPYRVHVIQHAFAFVGVIMFGAIPTRSHLQVQVECVWPAQTAEGVYSGLMGSGMHGLLQYYLHVMHPSCAAAYVYFP